MLRRIAGAGIGVALLTLGACGEPGGAAVNATLGGNGAFGDQIASALTQATAEGASENQIALLERARTEGKVSVEVDRLARRSYAQCAAAAGVEVTFDEKTRPDGWVTAVTAIDSTQNSDALQIAQACEQAESVWVTMLYSTQPVAEQATSDYLDQQAPVLSSCLTKAGFEPEQDATGMELAMLSTQGDDPTMRDAGAACLTQIGVDGF